MLATRLTMAVLFFSCYYLTGNVANAQETLDEIRAAHDERPHDPPAAEIDLPRTTSSGTARGLGQFMSVQVNVDVNGDNIVADAANEPSMALNPVDPDNIVVGWRQFDSISSNFRQAGVAYTTNGGQTWANIGPLDAGVFRSDPVLGEDSDGTIFYYSLTIVKSVFVCDMFISNDGGMTWTAPIPAGGGDKQWMTVDRSGGTSDGFIHAYWNFIFSCCKSGSFTRSIDGGQNYLTPIMLPQNFFWGTLSVGPSGELYVAGRDIKNDPYVLRSDDALLPGQIPTFPQVTFVDLSGGLVFSEGPNPGGLLGQFDVETNHAEGDLNGQVYLLGSVDPPGPDPLDVMFARSDDGGQTWSAPIRINTDAAAKGSYNWFGTMSVAPSGRIDVIWNDMRDDPNALLSALYYSSSSDGGLTWSGNLRVSQQFDSLIGHPNQNKIGDYYDMRSTDEAAHAIYSATFNGEQDVYYLRIDAGDVLLGDVNQDGVVTLLDVAPFVDRLVSGDFQAEADINQDGVVDLLDVQPFVDLLSG